MYQARDAPLGSRALEIPTALLERPGELVSKQGSTACVWSNIVVEPANLKVHMSALRDGHEGHWFIVNVPGLAAT
jgi:DNA-binding winged helix-turn-helix (wHTH) protein